MGVSLQTYRVRIGTFKQIRIRKIKNNGPSTIQFYSNYKSIIMILLMCSFVPIFIQLSEESLKLKSSPVLYPTSSACGTSSGPICLPGLTVNHPLPVPPWNTQTLFSEKRFLYKLATKHCAPSAWTPFTLVHTTMATNNPFILQVNITTLQRLPGTILQVFLPTLQQLHSTKP